MGKVKKHLTTTIISTIFNGNVSSVFNDTSSDEEEDDDEDLINLIENCTTAHRCMPGLLLPVWHPHSEDVDALAKFYRAIVYLLALAYVLFGVNIITERMLSCIEVIIAQKRNKSITTDNGKTHLTIQVPLWHPVVATLTIHVIGSSAAEIFLPLIEMVRNNFQARELGFSLIVGSGAYRLFITTGLCIISVNEPIGKRIKDLRVFFVTSTFAIFGYLWVVFLVSAVTPGQIGLWESLVTMSFFPILVITAWFVGRRFDIIIRRKVQNWYHSESVIPQTVVPVVPAERRRNLAKLWKNLKETYPDKDPVELEGMAQIELLENLPKDAAFYRMQTAKEFSGGGDVISKEKIKKRLEGQQNTLLRQNISSQFVGFEEAWVSCLESCGSACLRVRRGGVGVEETELHVDFETVPGTALPDTDYETVTGTLGFPPGVLTRDIAVKIIDDDEFENDKELKVLLRNPRIESPDKTSEHHLPIVAFTNMESVIQILDDDHCGVFHFETSSTTVPDNVGMAKVKVLRSKGARGRVQIPFKIVEDSAKIGQDFALPGQQELMFENDQAFAFIEFVITPQNRVGETSTLAIELGQPIVLSQPPQNPLGNPAVGDHAKIDISIGEDVELQQTLDRLEQVGEIADLIALTSWIEQFRDALQFDMSTLTAVESGIIGSRTKRCFKIQQALHFGAKLKRYLVYSLSLPWKLLAAVIPPARYFHGWLAFILLLSVMALLSALIADLASAFGCTIGLKDAVTAITLIAFGMGLPDTFASRRAAILENHADAAIGHITGSNAVSVFLGIGMSWTAASLYHHFNGTDFKLPHSNMGLIVVVYCALALVSLLVLLLRRLPPIRGELGGPRVIKYITAAFLLFLWFTFVVLLTFQSYCIIGGF